jgi:hypothetical protein
MVIIDAIQTDKAVPELRIEIDHGETKPKPSILSQLKKAGNGNKMFFKFTIPDNLRNHLKKGFTFSVFNAKSDEKYGTLRVLESNMPRGGGKRAYGFAALGEDWPLLPGERMHDSFVAMASSGLDVQKPRYAVPRQQLQQYNKGENASGGRNHAFTKRLFR